MTSEKEPPIRLEISPSQYWLIIRGLSHLTSQAGALQLFMQYPHLDRAELKQDIDDLLDRMEQASQRREFEKRRMRK